MFTKSIIASAALALAPFALALPQVTVSEDPISASAMSAAVPPPPVKSSTDDVTSHGPYTGPPPTTTGALMTTVLAASIPALPPNPTATTYPSDGKLHDPEPAPYTPAGGLGTNGTEPIYNVKSDFDYESIVSYGFHSYCTRVLNTIGTCLVSRMDRARSLPQWSCHFQRRRIRGCRTFRIRPFSHRIYGRPRSWTRHPS